MIKIIFFIKDFEKALDIFNYEFLLEILECRNFIPK
jgi:hypothetical protein